jgi:hypothetical protein
MPSRRARTNRGITTPAPAENAAGNDRPTGATGIQDILDSGTVDVTYTREVEAYQKWINDNWDDDYILMEFPNMGRPPGEEFGNEERCCYITRSNLDAYFTFVVAHRVGGRDHIKRIQHALKRYSTHQEHHLLDDDVRGSNFESETMKAALRAQQIQEKHRGSIGWQLDDKCPHRFCKHTLSISERTRVVSAAMKSGEWQNAIIAINLGHNIAIRGASTRQLTISDLRLSNGYGPGSNKSDDCRGERFDRTLLVILRKGQVHKDRFKTTKQVGFWRHKNWLLDPNFSIGLSLIYNLRKAGRSIEFTLRPEGGNLATTRPHWWDRPLIEWTDGKGN